MAGWKGITKKPVHWPLRLWVSIHPAKVDDENQYEDVMQIVKYCNIPVRANECCW